MTPAGSPTHTSSHVPAGSIVERPWSEESGSPEDSRQSELWSEEQSVSFVTRLSKRAARTRALDGKSDAFQQDGEVCPGDRVTERTGKEGRIGRIG